MTDTTHIKFLLGIMTLSLVTVAGASVYSVRKSLPSPVNQVELVTPVVTPVPTPVASESATPTVKITPKVK